MNDQSHVPTPPGPRVRRWLDWLARFDETMSLDAPALHERRLRRLEAEVARLAESQRSN